MTTAVVDSPDSKQAQAWWFLDTLVVEHRCASEMNVVVLEMTLPAGSAPPLHVHDDLDDTWYILEGQMVVRCGGEELVVGAGHWVSMPRGVPHTFRVVGEARRGSSSSTTTPASVTSFAPSALRPGHVSCRATQHFHPWANWRALLRPMTSDLSGLP